MIFETSQDTYNFTDLNTVNNIGIKISGGLDSAILCYMLFKTIHEQKLNTNVYIITTNMIGKAYQVEYSTKVWKWCWNKFENVTLKDHVTNECNPDNEDYAGVQRKLLDELYNNKTIDRHYMGVTANPPEEVYETFDDIKGGDWIDARDSNTKKPQTSKSKSWHRPFVNTNKAGIKELYDQFNLLEPGSLFDQTRTCEEWTNDFSKHCGKCWFCKERLWGFGKLD
jgi:hypothetical protein